MPATHAYSFGDYTLDLRRGALLRGGADVRLRPKSFEVLRLLLERHGQLVTREEILDAVWGDVVVTDGVLGQSLIDVRRAIGDASQQIVRTVPRRGYIFDQPVTEERGELAAINGVAHAPPADLPATHSAEPQATPQRRNRSAVILGAVLLLMSAGAGVWWLLASHDVASPAPRAQPLPSAARNSIAVLPFVDMSPEQNQEYFADGVSEEILNLLGNSPELQVIARTSSFSFKGRNADIAEIARKLNVAHVLEGSVRKDGNHLRVTAQLIDARDSSHLWSETYDRELKETFAVQSEIATKVSEALKVTLVNRGDASSALTPNSQAHESYLRGRFFFNRRAPGDTELAEQNYRQALQADPQYARAWEGLAGVYGAKMAEGTISRDEGVALRWKALQAALQYDPDLPEAHIRTAWHYHYTGQSKLADEHANRAYELDRDNPLVLGHFADRMAWHERLDEGLAMMQRAVMVDPLSTVRRGNYASYLTAAGRTKEAREQLLRALELSPATRIDTDVDLTRLLVIERRFTEARAMAEALPQSNDRDQMLAMSAHALNDEPTARAAYGRLEAQNGSDAATLIAEIHAQRGEMDEAFRWMAIVRERLGPESWNTPRWHDAWTMRFSYFLRLMRSDPRWESASRIFPHKDFH